MTNEFEAAERALAKICDPDAFDTHNQYSTACMTFFIDHADTIRSALKIAAGMEKIPSYVDFVYAHRQEDGTWSGGTGILDNVNVDAQKTSAGWANPAFAINSALPPSPEKEGDRGIITGSEIEQRHVSAGRQIIDIVKNTFPPAPEEK